MRKLAAWLGIAAIALQIAWPLVAVAKPRAVTLVPLCTVDGITHYLEVPTGKPLGESSSHGSHCTLCCLGQGAALVGHCRWLAACAGPGEALAAPAPLPTGSFAFRRGARAPPAMPLAA